MAEFLTLRGYTAITRRPGPAIAVAEQVGLQNGEIPEV